MPNNVQGLIFIDQEGEGVEMDNLLLERKASIKSNTSRTSSVLSSHDNASIPTVQVIPPSVASGKKCVIDYFINGTKYRIVL